MTTSIETSRFGAVEYTPLDVVCFSEGLVGLPNLREFVILNHSDESPFRWLQSLDEPKIAFLVVDPARYTQSYSPELPDSVAISLDLQESTPVLVYTVVTIPVGSPKEMTLNLAGPIVVNAETRAARQVVLDDGRYPVKFPAFSAAAEAA